MKKRKGFTLIELLVVISIIALLISILMPALNKARGQAQMAMCSTQIHGIGIAIGIYKADLDTDKIWETYPIMMKSKQPTFPTSIVLAITLD